MLCSDGTAAGRGKHTTLQGGEQIKQKDIILGCLARHFLIVCPPWKDKEESVVLFKLAPEAKEISEVREREQKWRLLRKRKRVEGRMGFYEGFCSAEN